MSTTDVGTVLFDRFAQLHHAANLIDFKAYCSRKALLSRDELAKTTNDYTIFYSDESDKKRGVWNRVFGNLQDFGGLFWALPHGTPNVYGPITLVFDRAIWKTAVDIAISRVNAAAPDFDLAAERLSAADVALCFERDGIWWKLKCNGIEASIGVSSLSFSGVRKVIVDPVAADFVERVRVHWVQSGYDGATVVARAHGNRDQPEDRSAVFGELVNWSRGFEGNVPQVSELKNAVPLKLQQWADGLCESQWPALRQWLVYTFVGSLR